MTAGSAPLSDSLIRRAAQLLKPVIHSTPLEYSHILSERLQAKIYLKMENLQRTGSFKIRGAYAAMAMLPPAVRRRGVLTASAGNHAQGVAYAAREFGVPATIVMPVGSSLTKEQACRRLGARVILHGDNFEEAHQFARKIAAEAQVAFIPPFDDPAVVAGQGTIGLEILRQLRSVDLVVASVGGGGLLAGVASAVKQRRRRVKVFGVQAAGAAAMARSLKEKRVVGVACVRTIADGIAVARPSPLTFALVRRWADGVVTVSDSAIAEAVLFLMEGCKTVVEAAGAAPLAALFANKISVRGKKVALILSGGNIDTSLMGRIIEKGLVTGGRLIELTVILTDKPGALERLAAAVAAKRANIVSIEHRRDKRSVPIGEAEVSLQLETRGPEHVRELLRTLRRAGYPVRVQN